MPPRSIHKRPKRRSLFTISNGLRTCPIMSMARHARRQINTAARSANPSGFLVDLTMFASSREMRFSSGGWWRRRPPKLRRASVSGRMIVGADRPRSIVRAPRKKEIADVGRLCSGGSSGWTRTVFHTNTGQNINNRPYGRRTLRRLNDFSQSAVTGARYLIRGLSSNGRRVIEG